ncbi:MAG: excinuclease ABC subunit C [Bacteroidia bacterium]|jgi:excinuclease ABC subunit C
MSAKSEIIKDKLSRLPKSPGVYKFYDAEKIIYIGKAKILRNRVSSYFNQSAQHSRKTKKLVSEIRDLEFVVVNTEFDALLLESNLIKTHQPKYNILLKDDKSYPFICVTNEPFPRVFATRQTRKATDRYFGPYAGVRNMNNVLLLVKKLYTVRSCTFFMDNETVADGKHKVCLEYHIKNCQGPCEALQSEEDYNRDIEQVIHILKGNLGEVKTYFKDKMQLAVSELDFEVAQVFKEKLERLESYQAKSLVANPNISDLDCFSIISDEDYAYINFLKIVNGSITQTHSVEVKKKLEEADEDILAQIIFDLRERFNSHAKRIISNVELPQLMEGVESHFPKIGDLRKIVELSLRNAMFYKKERLSTKVDQQVNRSKNYTLLQLKADLNLQDLPRHIECFDNSNIQGTNPVASMVCFKDGKPSKKDYRKYHIKTVIGPDDFKSMNEVVHRRYKRLIEEGSALPNLIVIDGGKGQLSSACDALKGLGIYGKIPIVGIAKRLEEIYYPEDSIPIHISKKSRSLVLLQQCRDEAHRFAINFHRNLRSAGSLTSELDEISGVGEKTVNTLLSDFRTVAKIKTASLEELENSIGKAKAKIVKGHFEGNN